MTVEEKKEDYFSWLMSKVVGEFISDNEIEVGRVLYSIPYRYILEFDAHRRDDGLGLREMYEDETGNIALWEEPCSVLEVLVSTALYVAEDVIGTFYNSKRTIEWFWMMLDNLGILGIGDPRDPAVHNYISKVVDKWLDRKFDYDGTGSPFPIRRPSEDQRKIEIWKQICAYIVDNPWLEM